MERTATNPMSATEPTPLASATAPTTTVRRSESIAKLATAVTKAVAELKNPSKDSINPYYNSKYADLATVRDAVLPVLARHDLAVLQLPCELDSAAALTTLLTHTSGEWVETTIKLRPVRNDPQGVGSALTYARRYALQSIAGVAAEDDDDGNAAGRREREKGAEANSRKPASESPALAGTYTQQLSRCRTQAEYTALCKRIKEDIAAKRLTNGDREALIAAARETATRFPQEPAANGVSNSH
ncbi:MAG TPA: ERF family protein [Tepidiformaceae bacterium]|nr:ERF family protein [Tepidiformaceae bacterium]